MTGARVVAKETGQSAKSASTCEIEFPVFQV